ncbi:MAG TPA: phosphodiester glycosidase family protein [Kofleriaceae bacterium]|nr:phosphodiester glycosidase family protein [Kofleriaceae bacterium]
MRLAAACVFVLAWSGAAAAEDQWSAPFPGVERLHRTGGNQNINVLVVDLCAPGVSIRATGGDERGRTVSSFGELVGAAAAVNGDFFGSGFSTDGLAVHAGAQWSGSDHTYVAPLAFGARRAELRPHEDQAGLEPWMQEVVSGHPTILWDGQQRDNNGDPLCSNRHPRTAVGLSADRRTLIVAVVDGRATSRIGMTCDELSALLREMGADDGMNLDGGGSSTMWLAGAGVVNVPSDGSQRTVGNHLGVHATGSGDAPYCPGRPPRGALDGATCEAVSGWAQDEDRPDEAIDVHVYFDGGPGQEGAVAVAARADQERTDLCDAIGSCAHGYSLPVPYALRDGAEHPVQVYAIDPDGTGNPAIGEPKTVSCGPPAPPYGPSTGRLRHLTSPESLAAWGFSFLDVAPLAEADVAAYPIGEPMPAAPDLVRAAGSTDVFLLDGALRRPAPAEVLAAWGLDPAAAREAASGELDGIPIGARLPEPFALRGSGPEVYALDVADPTDPEAGAPDDAPGTGIDGACGCGATGGGGAWLAALALLISFTRGRRDRTRTTPRR